MNEIMQSDISDRIIGLDLARSIAIFGMILVNYNIIFKGDNNSILLNKALEFLEGKAAATFVVLAGVGISLMMRNPSKYKRNMLIKRAIFLFITGLAYSPLWPADILHFYGVYLLIAAFSIKLNNNGLLLFAIISPLIFIALLIFINYSTGWNFATLAYTDFWTLQGMLRHIFYNGFHPVFPWISFIYIGMWLGRQDLNQYTNRIFGIGVILVSLTTGLSKYLIQNVKVEEVEYIFGTKPLPPFPLFILLGVGYALIVISSSIIITKKYIHWMLNWMIEAGQLSLSNYVSHIVIGVTIFEIILGSNYNVTQLHVSLYASLFFILSIIGSHFWKKRFNRGPLELFMRSITG